VDDSGNIEASKSDLIKIDRTAPTFDLSCTSSLLNGTPTQTVAGAADDRSGFAEDPNGTSDLDGTVPGQFTTTAEIQDKAGNTTSHTCAYGVVYDYSGLLQPINADGSSVFKLGSTVPVKLQLRDIGGVLQSAAIARLEVVKLSDDIEGDVLEAVSTSAATTGNLFRYDGGQYIFNLSTKGLSTGTWNLKVTLDDGTQQRTRIGLR
jgi:hypothetical protein